MPMAALEALDATGRPLMLLFPLFKGKKRSLPEMAYVMMKQLL
jgi:hypothetical protein